MNRTLNSFLCACGTLWLTAGLFAAEPCPISFISTGTKLNAFREQIDPDRPEHLKAFVFDIGGRIKNDSGKSIRSMKFMLYYFDQTEDLYPTPFAEVGPRLKSGEVKNWHVMDPFPSKVVAGWLFLPEKILFEDGTSFTEAQDTPGCYGELWFKKNHPRLTKLPEGLVKEK